MHPDPQDRLAIAMWDFSWLVRRTGAEAEYRDWDAVLSGLAERGYNCVRIDAFPHLISEVVRGGCDDRFRIHPQKRSFPWGNHQPVSVAPRASLLDFIAIASSKGIRVGLSSWFNDDDRRLRHQVANPEQLLRVWRDTLGLLASEGLLGHIAWVDLCNEFPLGEWLPAMYRRVFGRRWPNLIPLLRRWTPSQQRQIRDTFRCCMDGLRQQHPDLPLTFSFQRIGFDNLRPMDVSCFDLAEAHVWLTEQSHFNLLSMHLPALIGAPGGIAIHRKLGPRLFALAKRAWLAELERGLDEWASWAGRNGLPLYTTEGWGPIIYDGADPGDRLAWRWVKEVCQEAVGMALRKGWTGICTSNFCQPHFPGMWDDVDWHRALTARITAGERM